MADLHDRIRAAIEARRERAQAAQRIVADWTALIDRLWKMDVYARDSAWEVLEAENPATVLRHVDRDLKVLERHKEVVAEGWGHGALVCELIWMASDGWPIDWPCDDIRDLAEAYGIEIEETTP